MIDVVTFFWKDPLAKHKHFYEFTTKHVNRLAKAFKQHVSVPYRFNCVTDSPEGIDPSLCRVVPLWNDFRDIGRCYTRLKIFSTDMRHLFESRILQIDLDTVVLGNLDHILKREGNFIGYRDSKNPECYSGAMYLMDIGAKSQVYTTFNRMYRMVEDKEKFKTEFNFPQDYVGSDQSWMTEVIGPGCPKFGQEDGIFDYWTIDKLPELPLDTRIVFMNGMRRDASMAQFQKKHPWVDKWWNEQ